MGSKSKTMETKTKGSKKVSVVGLGQMGSTLARLLLKNGYQVTVWNRTRAKAEELLKLGAGYEEQLNDAIQKSAITVICLFDYRAAREIMDRPEVTFAIRNKTLIQLTTGSPAEAEESEAWAHQHKAGYIDGAIQVAPEQMAKADTTIFVSGSADAYSMSEEILKVFGGNIRYLGENIGAAAAMDLASLSYLYGSLLGFFHAARIAEVEGFRTDLLGDIIRDIAPGFAEFIQYEAKVIQSGDFAVTQSPLSISVEATARILRASEFYKINTAVPGLFADLFQRANRAGYGKEELGALIKVFRS